ncbi:hypothetical protein OH492_11970 [Vibrio chagasii]|nr:hypothetical protein [Vibrio chagasii]
MAFCNVIACYFATTCRAQKKSSAYQKVQVVWCWLLGAVDEHYGWYGTFEGVGGNLLGSIRLVWTSRLLAW